MSGLNLQNIKIQLIRGGVAPKFVNRSLAELNAHYSDLRSQAISDGYSETEADEKAIASIGEEETLIAKILDKRELKTWLWRYPRSTFLLLPLLILVLSILIFGIFLYYVFSWSPELADMLAGTQAPLWLKLLLESLSFFNFYLLTPMLAVGIILVAKQRMIPLLWPVIGMALLMFIGCGWKYSINWPTESIEGYINFQWGYSFIPFTARVSNGIHNLMNILLCISLSTVAWWVYRPYESAAENI